MPILICEKGSEKGLTLKIEPGSGYLCGRDPESSIRVTDVMTSRRHFTISDDGNGFVLTDLGSRNGTFLNDEAVKEPQPLKIGDKIQVGDTLFSFLSDKKEETAQGLVGKTVGGYQILDRIGRGGMGTVYKAKQLSLNRDVALKVLSARLLKDPDFVERFQNEARAAGQLNHPNIVQVYDVGTSHGLHFFSMEYMEQGSVQDHLGKDGRLSWEEALDMMIDVARGLVYAQKNDIVHRDIKPDNFMISADGSVKIGDLGLATRTEESAGNGSKGSIFGTPHFISPEQAQGLEVEHAADLYSLGAAFYRIMSGRTPFLGEQVQAIIRQQIVDEPPPLRELCADVPPAIANVIVRLMKKDPSERYPSASDLVEDLEAIRMTHHPAMRAGRKGRLALILGGVVVVAAIAGAFLLGGNGNGNPDVPPPIVGTTNPGTGTDARASELEEELRRVRAKDALRGVRDGMPNDGVITDDNFGDPAWDTVLEKLETEIVQGYSGTPSAEEAKALRESIVTERKAARERVEAARKAIEKRRAAARTAYRVLEETVEKLIAATQFSSALKAWSEASGKDAILALEETEKQYQALEGKIISAARNHALAVMGEADRLRQTGTKPNLVSAMEKIEAFLKAWNPGKNPHEVFTKARERAQGRLMEIKAARRTLLLKDLGSDFTTYREVYQSVRKLEGPVDENTNHVFRFAFGEAAEKLRAHLEGEGGLKTWPYRDRLKLKIADLERMERLMVRFIEKLESGEAITMDLQVRDMAKLKQRSRIMKPITREGFQAEIRALRAKVNVKFEDFTPAQLIGDVFLDGRRVPLEPADRLGLALMMAEMGLHASIGPVLDELGSLDALPESIRADAKAVVARLEPERRAAAEWASIREAYDSKPESSAELAEIEARIRKFEIDFARTDFFMLIECPPQASQGLVSPDAVKAFLENLGEKPPK